MTNITSSLLRGCSCVNLRPGRSCTAAVLALTGYFAKSSISPESSDGFASVGTILPSEKAALLPGGLLFSPARLSRIEGSFRLSRERATISYAGLMYGAKWPIGCPEECGTALPEAFHDGAYCHTCICRNVFRAVWLSDGSSDRQQGIG